NRPATICVLVPDDLSRGLLQAHFIARSQKGMQQNVVGFEGCVGFEFAGPVSFRLLGREEESSRAVHRRGYAAGDVIDLAKHHLRGARGDFVNSLIIPRRRQWWRARRELQPRSPAGVRNERSPP